MQSRSSQSAAMAITETETYQTMLARAHRRTGGVPPEGIVRHVLSVTHGGDWPVQRDALEAVLRRCALESAGLAVEVFPSLQMRLVCSRAPAQNSPLNACTRTRVCAPHEQARTPDAEKSETPKRPRNIRESLLLFYAQRQLN
jgi:hypothetical protein